MTKRQLLHSFASVLFAGVLCSGLQAGTINGRVTDGYTKLALGGARISVGPAETYAESTGEFTLRDVPAGVQTVEVSYVGYAALKLTLDVAESGVTRLNPIFNREVVQLDQFVISGSRVGTARALNEQRAAETLTNLVAADEIGRFPDKNAAESAQRIPGVALYRDQGEGRFLVVRGIRPDLNGVQLNGLPVTSPDRGARTVPLDVIPSDALGAVEVTKVPRPDLDFNGLGGRVNLKTRSPFDADGRQAQFVTQGQWNNLRERYSSKVNGTYSDVVGDGKIGFILSPTWEARRFGSDNFETGGTWTVPVGNTALMLPDLMFRQYMITRTRYGGNAAIEYRPDPSTVFYLRGLYSYFDDSELRYITQIPFTEGLAFSVPNESTATVSDIRRENKQLRVRSKQQDLTTVSAGFEKTIGDWRLEGRAATSEGVENRKEDTVIFRKGTRGSTWTYSFPGVYAPTVTQTAGTPISDPTLFNELNRLRTSPGDGRETEQTYGFDARRELTLADGARGYFKTGGQYRAKTKKQSRNQVNFTAPATFTFASLAEAQDQYAFFTGPRVNATKFTETFINNRSAYTGTVDTATNLSEGWQSEEDVLALYGLGGVTRGALSVSGGVRWERTEFTATGNEQRTTGGVVSWLPASRSATYDHYLPGVYLRYDVDKQNVVRASWSTSLARPSFSENAITRSVNDDSRQVVASNPGLKALRATHWDASFEHYEEKLGLFSIAAFYKDITDFTYRTSIPNGDPANPGYALTTFVNGNSGWIYGAEVGFQRRLDFLPVPGFSVTTNYTFTSSRATYLRTSTNTLDSAPFIGQSPHNANFALTYERSGLFLRLSLNYRSYHLREDEAIGDSAPNDIYIDDFKQLDLNGSYKLNQHWEVFAEVLNLTNEPFRVAFTPARTRLRQFEEYGWTAYFGVRWKL